MTIGERRSLGPRPLMVAGYGRPLGGIVEDSMLESLRASIAAGAGGWVVVVTGGMGAEVALTRSRQV